MKRETQKEKEARFIDGIKKFVSGFNDNNWQSYKIRKTFVNAGCDLEILYWNKKLIGKECFETCNEILIKKFKKLQENWKVELLHKN